MTLRYEPTFSHADRTVWIIYPMPSKVIAGQPIQQFRDEPDQLAPSARCKAEIRSWYASVTGTERHNIRFVPYR